MVAFAKTEGGLQILAQEYHTFLDAYAQDRDIMFVFGNVRAGFAQVETPYIYATARSGLANNSSIVNVADVGGLYDGQWIQAVSRWLTTIYAKTTVRLPKTGY